VKKRSHVNPCEALETRQLLTYTVFGTPGHDVFQVQPGASKRRIRGLFETPQRPSMIEALEPRRLLSTLTVNGTSGNDVIAVSHNGVSYNITVNGVLTTSGVNDSEIIIEALGGNDFCRVVSTGGAETVRFRGGLGDDDLFVAGGDFSGRIDGTVVFEENANAGQDDLTIEDAAAPNPNAWHVGTGYIYADEFATFDARVNFNTNVEAKVILQSALAETTFIDAPVEGVTINLGNGNDLIQYGGPSSQLNGFVLPMTVIGGGGTDRITFDDRGGDANVPRDYDANATSILNQTLTGIETAELYCRNRNGDVRSSIVFTGNATVSSFIGIYSDDAIDFTFGTAASRLDLDQFALRLEVDIRGDVSLFDQDANNSASSWNLFEASAGVQRLSKGTFLIDIIDDVDKVEIQCGSTNDVLYVQKQFNQIIAFRGNGGDDQVIPGGPNMATDLGAIFTNGFYFYGGPGNDYIELDDSASPANPSPNFFIGGLVNQPQNNSSAFRLNYSQDVEQIAVFANNDSTNIDFRVDEAQRMTINGSGGNDTIGNGEDFLSGLNSDLAGLATLSGGAGADVLAFRDEYAAVPGADLYTLTSNTFSYVNFFTGEAVYDGFETFYLYQSFENSTTNLVSKPSTMGVVIEAAGGNDVINVGGGDFDSNNWALTTLAGGAGTDTIVIDDRNDSYSFSETETLSVRPAEVTKGNARVDFTQFEAQQIFASGGGGGPALPGIIDLITTLPSMPAITITGAAARPVSLIVNDNISVGSDSYSLTATQLTKPGQNVTLNYSNVGVFTLQANTRTNSIFVGSTSGGVVLNGNNGDDIFTLGGGNLGTNLASSVAANGDGGFDRVVYDNAQDGVAGSATFANSTFTDVRTHTYSAEIVRYLAGPGGGTLRLNQVPAALHEVFNAIGTDTVLIGNGNLDANVLGQISVNGADVPDSVTIDDRLDNSINGDHYRFFGGPTNSFQKTLFGGALSPLITAPGVLPNSIVLQASDASNTANVEEFSAPLSLYMNAGNDAVTVADPSSVVNVDTGSELLSAITPRYDTVVVNSDFGAGDLPATVRLVANDIVGELTIRAGGKLIIEGEITAHVQDLFVNQGTVDLGGNMLINPGAASSATVTAWVRNGRNNGLWNGTNPNGAIHSLRSNSSALSDSIGYGQTPGIGQPSQLGITSIGGFAFHPFGNQTLLRYTLDGDADLNQTVNLDDFTALASSFGAAATWVRGDFDYSSSVDLNDFTALAANFGRSLPIDLPRTGVSHATTTPVFGSRRIGEGIDGHDDRHRMIESIEEQIVA